MRFKFTFLFFFMAFSVTAQEEFVALSLHHLYDQLPNSCKKQLLEKKECEFAFKGMNYRLRSEMDGNLITHIGLNVFNDSIHKLRKNVLYNFIEREFLKFILSDNLERNARFKEDHVYLFSENSIHESELLNSPDLIQRFTGNIVGISFIQDSIRCKILFTNSKGEKLGMIFPVNNSIIRGMDKKELDEEIISQLSKDRDNQSLHKRNQNCDYLNKGDLLFCKGENFYIENFSSDIYYKKVNGSLSLVFDKNYVSESFSNLFISELTNNNPITLNFKMKSYANTDKVISLQLNKFLSKFDDNCKFYFGIEDNNNAHLRGTLLIYNQELNYLHLLDIRTDAEKLFGNFGQVTGTFYPFIPTDNIKNIFRRDIDSKTNLVNAILKGN